MKNREAPFHARSIDAVVLSHAHIAESDCAFVNRHRPNEEPADPLFTMAYAGIECLEDLSGTATPGTDRLNEADEHGGGLKRVFLGHGEPERLGPLAERIRLTCGIYAIPVQPR